METTLESPALRSPDLIPWLQTIGLESLATWVAQHPFGAALAGLLAIAFLAAGSLWLTRGVLLKAMASMARRSTVTWDDALIQHRVFHRLSWAVPVVLVHQLVPWVPGMVAVPLLQRLAICALVLIALSSLGALFGAINAIYSRYPMARNRPIKGYLQVVLIIGWVFGVVVVVAMVMDRSPWLLLSGLGAMTAVLLLVFRDTLLSLVAGVQLTTNDLIRVGDWIEMPQFAADGDVVDIGLHAVKVQNWDRTITVIPTHRFLEHSFKNWRGMTESGGRRIKRSFNVDTRTIRFLSDEEVDTYGRYVLLSGYIAQKRQELAEYNRQHQTPGLVSNARRLTNVGTLRAWIVAYLKQHPMVRQDMTFLVRQLQPGPEGLPIEIYVFCNDTRWAVYEGVQADIFDHVLSMLPEFGLRVFQNPSGHDIAQLAQTPALTEALRASLQASAVLPDVSAAEPSAAETSLPRNHLRER